MKHFVCLFGITDIFLQSVTPKNEHLRLLYTLFSIVLLTCTLQAGFAVPETSGHEVYSVPDGNTNLSIFPNPVKTEATISYTSDVQRIAILNIVGREVIAYNVEPGSTDMKINFSDLQPGVYFIAAQSQGKNLVTKRFMKDL